MHMPRLMICATKSGSGKTFITCGILAAIKKRGLRLHAFKCGPDYIDTMFHEKVIEIPSHNLDSYFVDEKVMKYIFSKENRERDIAVIEGVMGYYDGIGGVSEHGSTYEIADILDTPSVLIVPCDKMSTSVAALVNGFVCYKEKSHIKGIILNKTSEKMYLKLKPFIEAKTGVKVYGYLPWIKEIELKSRHLGLVRPEEIKDLADKLNNLSDTMEKTLDIDGLISLADKAPEIDSGASPIHRIKVKRVKVAVSKDEAFCFLYRDNIDILKELGASIVYFSPLHDAAIPDGVSGIIITGGYPELYAKMLSENNCMISSIRSKINEGMPVIAECGGFMYLNKSMEDDCRKSYDMVGVIDGVSYKTEGLKHFGYANLTALKDQLLLKKGEEIRIHEFHHWDSTSCGKDCDIKKASGEDKWKGVHSDKNIYAGFPHIYFYANPDTAVNFLNACSEYNSNHI